MPQLKLTLPIFFLVIAFFGINSEPELDGHGNTDSVSNEEQRLIEKVSKIVSMPGLVINARWNTKYPTIRPDTKPKNYLCKMRFTRQSYLAKE